MISFNNKNCKTNPVINLQISNLPMSQGLWYLVLLPFEVSQESSEKFRRLQYSSINSEGNWSLENHLMFGILSNSNLYEKVASFLS